MDGLSSPLDDIFATVAEMPTRTLSDRIKFAAQAHGMDTPSALARKMGLNRQTVTPWWNGDTTKLTPEMWVRLGDALEVSIRWLINDGGEMYNERTVTTEQAEVLTIFESLRHTPTAAEKWVSQGRDLVELLAPVGRNNPFSHTRK